MSDDRPPHRIQMPWKDRVNYLRITLATLSDAALYYPNPDIDYPDYTLTIFDDASTEAFPWWSADRMYSGNRVRGLEYDLIDMPSKTDCHHNYVNMLNWMFNKYPDAGYVVNIDADACIHPEFFKALEQLIEDCPDFGHASLFNWDSHPEDTERYKEIYIPRKHSSFFCSVIRREAWEMFTPPKLGEPWDFGCADGHFSTFVHEKTPFKVYSTLRSYAENIGSIGKHAGEDHQGKTNTVRARRFYS